MGVARFWRGESVCRAVTRLAGFVTLVLAMIAASMSWELRAHGVSALILGVGAVLTLALIWPAARFLRGANYEETGN